MSFGALVGVALFLTGLALGARQAWLWLRTGEWPSLSCLDLVAFLTSDPKTLAWVAAPSDWVGLHRVLTMVPLALALVGSGIVVLLAVSSSEGPDAQFDFTGPTTSQALKVLQDHPGMRYCIDCWGESAGLNVVNERPALELLARALSKADDPTAAADDCDICPRKGVVVAYSVGPNH